jgi:UDP-N-acetyl-D-mannosaminuronic acid dehydrogenase
MIDNDRLVGGINKASAMAVGDFYGSFVKGKVVLTNAKTAEFSKLAENSYRDVNIAFANELSIIADRQGVDVCELIKLANLHPRVNILQPGPGVGGHCIAVDPWFIVSSDLENSKLIRTAREVNNSKKDWVLNKIELEAIELEKKLGRKPTISFMGITYKPNIDDLRESPSLAIVKDIDINYKVLVVDPYIEIDTSLNIVNFDIAFQQADLIVVLVKHDFFCCEEILMKLSKKITLDFCGLTNKANMQMN